MLVFSKSSSALLVELSLLSFIKVRVILKVTKLIIKAISNFLLDLSIRISATSASSVFISFI